MKIHAELELFHPVIGRWFADRYGDPTGAQRLAWPRIADGENVLVTAPTGSGKTLTAFLWALDQLAKEVWQGDAVRVLYVSPLRALNNDIRRNLTGPLKELQSAFETAGQKMPPIRAATRSGDTPQAERRQMLRHPPEILITTPESLNILLTSSTGSALFHSLETVILDEVHAVAGTKRGTHLITAVERLTRLSDEFQRIALSATVQPLEHVAEWVGGFELLNRGETPEFRPRPVTIIDPEETKTYDVEVCFKRPPETQPVSENPEGNPIWQTLADEASERILRRGSTLVFANSRRTVERVARMINAERDERLVYSHHGSLSREIREVVEERLKAGELQGIVATNSLELGIDVGAIDEVLLIETPPSIASAIQRLGRAGHAVGETSRGMLYPVYPEDVLDAAVVVRGLLDGDVEPVASPEAPLDVLAQVVLSMTATEEWTIEELYDFIRTARPYQSLSRRVFDIVIEMLAGRYQGTRLSALRPRLAIDRVNGTVQARQGTARLIYAAGGTIPDRGNFRLRHAETRAVIGELDEEFVWERSVGETLTLGVQTWRIQGISQNDVFVTPSGRPFAQTPFWRCEEQNRSFWLAERRGRFLERADERLDDPRFHRELSEKHHLDEAAIEELVRLLKLQKKATGCGLPHRRHIVVERIADVRSVGGRGFTVAHTGWGGRVNSPFAMALGAAAEERFGTAVEAAHDDGCVALDLPEPCDAEELLRLVRPEEIERLLRTRLESTGVFGAHFRENAGRALLLPRAGFGRRTPLWLSRQRAKELLDTVSKFTDFPIVLETWRTCLRDEFDLAALASLLEEIEQGTIALSEVTTTTPSPFAAEVVWKRTNELMYEDDKNEGPTELRSDLIEEVVFSPQLRPRIPAELVHQLNQKLQRTFPGYAPRGELELIEWVKERVFIPADEWELLLSAVERDSGDTREGALAHIESRIVAIRPGDEEHDLLVCAVEDVPRLGDALGQDQDFPLFSATLGGAQATPEARTAAKRMASKASDEERPANPLVDLLGEWLRFIGPVEPQRISALLGLEQRDIDRALCDLLEENRVVVDAITEGAKRSEVCDTENLARLLRMTRAAARPQLETLPVDALPLFLAEQQGLGARGDEETLRLAMERLFGYTSDAALWETEILPARLIPYRTAWLDALIAETDLQWFGRPSHKLGFSLASDQELFPSDTETDPDDTRLLESIFTEEPARFSVSDLLDRSKGQSSAELSAHLWRLTWNGMITNDGFAAIRRGIASGFKSEEPRADNKKHRRSRARFSRWKAARPFTGSWYRLPCVDESDDILAQEDLRRDRVRLLLDRYGVLFRELLARELPALRWKPLFRTLRILELSGEVIGGCFFSGVSGLQFISPSALALLRKGLDEDRIYWLCATDPASACGLGLEGLDLPRRVPGTHLVYCGRTLAVVSSRGAKSLDVRIAPDDPRLVEYFAFLKTMLTRDAQPARAVVIEEINDKPAATSPYRHTFEALFDVARDHRTLRLSRRY